MGEQFGQAVVVLRMLALVDELAQKLLIGRQLMTSGHCEALGRQFSLHFGLKRVM